MRAFPNGETLILNRRIPKTGPGRYDAYGVLQYDVDSETLSGVAIWPTTNTEVLQNQERTSTTYVVALPPTVRVDAIDYVTWRGLKYELRGDPEHYTHPITGHGLQTFAMFRVEG